MGGSLLDPRGATVVLATVALLAMVVVGAFRRSTDTPGRHLALLFGVGLLPTIALVAGTGTALREAERPEFCGSCHVMEPWINDLKDPKSTNLAAIHYQNRFILEDQCYTCHTDYAFFGPVMAKVGGVRHLWRWATNDFERPLKPYGGYNFKNCLHCHGEAKNFLEQHDTVIDQINDGSATCLDCHVQPHPAQEGEVKK